MKYKTPNDVNTGERILLDDGKLIFEIVETDKNRSNCQSDTRW
jgi:pyruvate kinase